MLRQVAVLLQWSNGVRRTTKSKGNKLDRRKMMAKLLIKVSIRSNINVRGAKKQQEIPYFTLDEPTGEPVVPKMLKNAVNQLKNRLD